MYDGRELRRNSLMWADGDRETLGGSGLNPENDED